MSISACDFFLRAAMAPRAIRSGREVHGLVNESESLLRHVPPCQGVCSTPARNERRQPTRAALRTTSLRVVALVCQQ